MVSACACFPVAASAVVHGNPASAGQWPWVARVVVFDRSTAVICSGSVIAPNVVLTAGHCAVDAKTRALLPAADYEVTTGTTNWLTSPGQVSAVSRVVLYPGWSTASNDVSDGDAALLQLATPTTAPALPLASPDADAGSYAAGTGAEVAGWGGTTVGNLGVLPDSLRWTTTTVQSTSWCQSEAQNHLGEAFDPVNQLCTIDAPTDSAGICRGDSGGPLVAPSQGGTIVEIGITSWMATGCGTTTPDFFQRVDTISSWLSRETADLSPPATTTAAASGVGHNTATLTGQVNPNGHQTTYYFQYGTTSSYGSTTVSRNVSGSTAAPVSVVLHGLKPRTVYRYRLVAVSATGTSDGADKTFTTLRPPNWGPDRGEPWHGRRISLAPDRHQARGISFGLTAGGSASHGPLGYTFTPDQLLLPIASIQSLTDTFSDANRAPGSRGLPGQPSQPDPTDESVGEVGYASG